jgi:hypothetical protein
MPFPQWSLRGEYLHAGFNNHMDALDFGVTITQHEVNIVRGGITYYLGADRMITGR